jgi:predicted Zn-dependent peptidase
MVRKSCENVQKINFIYNDSGLFIITAYIPSGSIYENIGKHQDAKISGISHFLEHLLFKHTKNYSGKELLENLTLMGGYYNASTDKDETMFYVKTLVDNYELATDIICDIVTKPVFKLDEVNSERKVTLEEYAQTQDSLDDAMYEGSNSTILQKDNIYMQPIIGNKKHLQTISIKQIWKYFHERYQHMMLVINCDERYKVKINNYVEKRFGRNKYVDFNEPHLEKLSLKFHEDNKISIVGNATYQYNTYLSFPSFKYALMKENVILNFIKFCLTDAGLYSLLYYEIREKRGLVYSIKITNDRMRYLGILKIRFATSNRDLIGIVTVIMDLINKIKLHGLSPSDLSYFKTSYLNHLRYKFTNEEFRASWHGDNLFYGCKYSEKKFIDTIKSIKNDDIKAVMHDVFGFDKMSVYTMGKYHEPKQLKHDLKKIIQLQSCDLDSINSRDV